MRTFPLKDIPLSSATFPDLAGKTAIVTGGERGIGQGIAAMLARQGMQVVIAGISAEEGVYAEAQFRAARLAVAFVEVDLVEEDSAAKVLAFVGERSERVDLLVNNAARNNMVPFLEYDDKIYQDIFENNVRMTMNMTRTVAASMVVDGVHGSIVNISSVGGQRAHRNSVAYNASKGAIEAMTRAIALDLAPHQIRVNAVAPGAVVNRPIDETTQDFRSRQSDGIPLGRVGNVTDVANMVCFLGSAAASYVTGQTFIVDGGLSAQLTPPGIYI